MSYWQSRPLVERIIYYYQRTRAWARRATVTGVAVRTVIWLTGVAAVLLAFPHPAGVSIGAALALLSAGWPRSHWVTLLLATVVGIVAIRLAGGAPDPSPVTLAVLAGMIYLHHTTAALAAQVRTDTVIPSRLLGQWAGRSGLVLAGSAVVAVLLGVLASPAWPATMFLLAGAGAVVGLVLLLLWARFRWSPESAGGE
jgi:hypothetical protein